MDDCSTVVTLYFRAEKLKDMDTFSKSDPYLQLYGYESRCKGPKIGATKTIQNSLNPKWEQGITMKYFFEKKQELAVWIFDDDNKGAFRGDDELFMAEFSLAHVMSSRGSCLKIQKGKSILYITAVEESTNLHDTVNISFAAKGLKNMDTIGKSDPYLLLYRLLPTGGRKQLWKSEVIDDNLEPFWKPCPTFKLSDLCGKNLDDPSLFVECYDEDTFSDDLIGCARFSLNQLTANAGTATGHDGFVEVEAGGNLKDKYGPIVLFPKEKEAMAGTGTKNHGFLTASRVDVLHTPTFAEHLAAGLQMNLAVSIDFTGSNGDPHNPTSLHYMNPSAPNQYVQAIMSVGDILMQYDTDKMIPAFGFGARLPDNQVSHFFHLNLSENPYLHGIQSLLDTYAGTLGRVRLSGPTNFSPSIRSITQGAMKTSGVYTVHLILTDGEITDMSETIDAIVAADAAPLSIVIVGVGSDCDFKMMDQLDGDGPEGLRDSRGKKCRRDLVQFVPFKRFQRLGPAALAAEVLKEIPGQVEHWGRLNNVKLPPPPATDF